MVPKGMEHQWDGKREFRLGATESEAYITWAQRLQIHSHAKTIADVLDRYLVEVVPAKAPKTRSSNRASLVRLRKVFGAMQIDDLKPIDVYRYFDARSDAPTSAHRDIEVLSHVYTMAIRWGFTEHHPIRDKVRLPGEKPRTRYVTDAELIAALGHANPVLRAYIAIKVLTGLRRCDILRLREADIQEDGIHVTPSKTEGTTGKRIIVEWSDDLAQAVAEARAARPKDITPTLFCTRKGEPYIDNEGSANGFDSMWQRFMAKCVTAGIERFQERDLRAKTASDMDPDLATALLGHADPKITQRVYRRKPSRVTPGRMPKAPKKKGS